MKARIAAVAALVAVLSGCATTPAPSTAVVDVGTGLEFRVQLATTPDQQRDGLSGPHELSEGTGMLFTFDGPAERQVWMAGMEIPIDVAWILDDQVIATDTLDPCTTETQDECPRWTSPGDADTLLEVPAGALDGIEPGTTVTIREDQSEADQNDTGDHAASTLSSLNPFLLGQTMTSTLPNPADIGSR